MSALKVLKDYFYKPEYTSRNLCIVTSTNAITCKNFGFTKYVTKLYPYGNVAELRYIYDEIGSAEPTSRGREGSIEMGCAREEINTPKIATLITQYGIGLPFYQNNVAQTTFRCTLDQDHARRLRNDTTDYRIRIFDDCLIKLLCEIRREEHSNIKVIFFPIGIGRGGRADAVWMKYYLPLLKSFAESISVENVVTCLLLSEGYEKYSKTREWGENSMKILNGIPHISRNEVKKTLQNVKIVGEDVCGINRNIEMYAAD